MVVCPRHRSHEALKIRFSIRIHFQRKIYDQLTNWGDRTNLLFHIPFDDAPNFIHTGAGCSSIVCHHEQYLLCQTFHARRFQQRDVVITLYRHWIWRFRISSQIKYYNLLTVAIHLTLISSYGGIAGSVWLFRLKREKIGLIRRLLLFEDQRSHLLR